MNPDTTHFSPVSFDMFDDLNMRLGETGMEILGAFHLDRDEALRFAGSEHEIIGLMIASCGQDMWQVFRASAQFGDRLPEPLDRWTKKVLEDIALESGAGLVLPFDRPYPPFQSWAKRASGICNSPLGVLIHPQYGLWFGLRGVLLVKVIVENQQLDKLIQQTKYIESPCDRCIEKPCLSSCPVNAFGDSSLNVKVCYSHLDEVTISKAEPDCLDDGCAARAACPVGVKHKYCAEQLRFHMKSYY